jgi:hypothetical protein
MEGWIMGDIRTSQFGGIPFGNNANRPSNPDLGKLYSNGEASRLELYTNTGWQNIVQETPGVVSISGVYNESAASSNITINGTNFAAGAIAYAVGSNGVDYPASLSTVNSIVQMVATFSNLSPVHEPYDIKIINPSNLYGTLPDALYVNNTPIWTTTSGLLGTFYSYLQGSVNINLVATDSESPSLTYTVVSGSLPSGVSLNSSTGAITGTIPLINNTTTYSFTIRASDGNDNSSRPFTILVIGVLDISDVTSTGLLTQASAENLSVGTSYSTLTPIAGSIGGSYVGRRGGGGTAPTYDGSLQSVPVVSWGTGKAFDQRGMNGWRSTANIPVVGLQPSTMILIGEVNSPSGSANSTAYHIGLNFGNNGANKSRAIASTGVVARNVWYSNDTTMTISAAIGSKDIYILRNNTDARNFRWNTKTQTEAGVIADVSGTQYFTDGPTPLWTQWRDDTGTQYPYGYIAEWMVFDRYLTDAEVARVIAYGKAKYGIV